MTFGTALSRALRLKCPQCGKANIADGWLSTTPSCSTCSADLTVETGYFLGAIYINCGATILIVLSAAIPLVFVAKLPMIPVVAVATIFCVAFPLWFFRYARSLWLAMDHYYHVRRRHSAESSASTENKTFRPNNAGDSVIGCICPFCHSRFHVDASFSRKWGKCPDCYGDMLFLPTTKLKHDVEKAGNSNESETHPSSQLSPLEPQEIS